MGWGEKEEESIRKLLKKTESLSDMHPPKFSFFLLAAKAAHITYLVDSIADFLWGIPWWLRRQRICLQCWTPGFDPEFHVYGYIMYVKVHIKVSVEKSLALFFFTWKVTI